MINKFVECPGGLVENCVKDALPQRKGEDVSEYIYRLMKNLDDYGYSYISPSIPMPIAWSFEKGVEVNISGLKY